MIAQHRILGAKVVIKSLPASDYEKRAQLFSISEVDAQRKCQSSDNVLGITDHFVIGKTHYIVTKYEAGSDLCEYMKARGLDRLIEAHAQYIFYQMALGLKDIHIQGIVHRDIKHKNIFLSN